MISEQMLDQICARVNEQVIGEPMLLQLRKEYPEVHFSWCFDDDIGATATPYREETGFNLYLVNSSDHCSKLSNDPEGASGVVVAELLDDEY